MVGLLRNRVVEDFVFKFSSECFDPPSPNLHRGIILLSAVCKVFFLYSDEQ